MWPALLLTSLLGAVCPGDARAQGLPNTVPQDVLAAVPVEVLRGDSLLKSGQPGGALEQYRLAIDRVGPNSDLTVRSATAVFSLGRCEEALEMAAPHRTEPVWTAQTSGRAAGCYARQGRYADAVYFQEEAVLLDPDAAHRWAMLGVYATRLGDEPLAATALAEARALDPDAVTLTTVTGVFALEHGQVEVVLDTFERLEAGRAQPQAMARYLYAGVLMDLGLPEQAAAVARSGLAQALRSPALAAATAEAERRTGNPTVARAVLDRPATDRNLSRELAPASVRTWVDLGQLDRAHHELHDALPHGAFSADLAAAAWYLADAEGDAAAARSAAERWALLNTSPLRSLAQLVPTGGRP